MNQSFEIRRARLIEPSPFSIVILPRSFIDDHNGEITEPHVIISITEPNVDNEVRFKDNPNRKDILRLSFMDIDCTRHKNLSDSMKNDGIEVVLYDKQMAIVVKEFLETYKNSGLTFVIHCGAGVSRSAAIGAAISKFINDDDEWFFKKLVPNRFVYRLTLETLMED